MLTWKQIFGPNFSVEQIELVLVVGAFGAISFGIFVLLYLYNRLAIFQFRADLLRPQRGAKRGQDGAKMEPR